MLRLSRIFKNYNETGSLSELINLYGFIGPHVFLTKSGDVGVILEVRGVDYECLDDASIDGFTKRLESALKLFDENYRVYQYLFKRNNETIPYKLYANPIVDTAIKNRIAYLASKADTLFSLSVYYVVLYQGFQTSAKLGSALAEFPKNPKKAVADLRAHFSGQKQIVVLGQHVSNARGGAASKSPQLHPPSQRLPRCSDARQTGSLPRSQKNAQLPSRQTRSRQAQVRHLPRLLPSRISC